jgi:hypothetical protein
MKTSNALSRSAHALCAIAEILKKSGIEIVPSRRRSLGKIRYCYEVRAPLFHARPMLSVASAIRFGIDVLTEQLQDRARPAKGELTKDTP